MIRKTTRQLASIQFAGDSKEDLIYNLIKQIMKLPDFIHVLGTEVKIILTLSEQKLPGYPDQSSSDHSKIDSLSSQELRKLIQDEFLRVLLSVEKVSSDMHAAPPLEEKE